MRRVVIASPFAGDVERHRAYARDAVRDSLLRGEAPFATHLLYPLPDVLHDDTPEDREMGMRAGQAWIRAADALVVYGDLGVAQSRGMLAEIAHAHAHGIAVEYRSLPAWHSEGDTHGDA